MLSSSYEQKSRKTDVEKYLRRFGMLCFLRANKFRNIRTTIFCFLKIFVNVGKIFVMFREWSGPVAKICEDILKLNLPMKSLENCKDECIFVF